MYLLCRESDGPHFFLSKYLFQKNENYTDYKGIYFLHTLFFHIISNFYGLTAPRKKSMFTLSVQFLFWLCSGVLFAFCSKWQTLVSSHIMLWFVTKIPPLQLQNVPTIQNKCLFSETFVRLWDFMEPSSHTALNIRKHW